MNEAAEGQLASDVGAGDWVRDFREPFPPAEAVPSTPCPNIPSWFPTQGHGMPTPRLGGEDSYPKALRHHTFFSS